MILQHIGGTVIVYINFVKYELNSQYGKQLDTMENFRWQLGYYQIFSRDSTIFVNI